MLATAHAHCGRRRNDFAPIGCAYPEFSMPTRAANNVIPILVILSGTGTLAAPTPTGKAITDNRDLAPAGAVTSAFLAVIPLPNGSTLAHLTILGYCPIEAMRHTYTPILVAWPPPRPGRISRITWIPRRHLSSHQAIAGMPIPATRSGSTCTTAGGIGVSNATVPFAVTGRAPGSIVIHEAMQTSTGPAGEAGKAGARIACLTLSG
jgi:hypothetical protein